MVGLVLVPGLVLGRLPLTILVLLHLLPIILVLLHLPLIIPHLEHLLPIILVPALELPPLTTLVPALELPPLTTLVPVLGLPPLITPVPVLELPLPIILVPALELPLPTTPAPVLEHHLPTTPPPTTPQEVPTPAPPPLKPPQSAPSGKWVINPPPYTPRFLTLELAVPHQQCSPRPLLDPLDPPPPLPHLLAIAPRTIADPEQVMTSEPFTVVALMGLDLGLGASTQVAMPGLLDLTNPLLVPA